MKVFHRFKQNTLSFEPYEVYNNSIVNQRHREHETFDCLEFKFPKKFY